MDTQTGPRMAYSDATLREMADDLAQRAPGSYLMLMEFADGNYFIMDSWAFQGLLRRGLIEWEFPHDACLTTLGLSLALFIRRPRDLPVQRKLL